jgi:hypothetical protein
MTAAALQEPALRLLATPMQPTQPKLARGTNALAVTSIKRLSISDMLTSVSPVFFNKLSACHFPLGSEFNRKKHFLHVHFP